MWNTISTVLPYKHPAENPLVLGPNHFLGLPKELITFVLYLASDSMDRARILATVSHQFREGYRLLLNSPTSHLTTYDYEIALKNQKDEIAYLTANIITQNQTLIERNLVKLKACSAMDCVVAFDIREELINKINELIILSRIDSQSPILDLRNCALTRFPSSVFSAVDHSYWSMLKKLNLCGNKIGYLAPQLGKVIGLKWLSLADNQLRALPSGLIEVTSLKTLHLEHNQLRALPEEIGKLSLLRSLYLHCNRITKIPANLPEDVLKCSDRYITWQVTKPTLLAMQHQDEQHPPTARKRKRAM